MDKETMPERWAELREYLRLRRLAALYLEQHPDVQKLIDAIKATDTNGQFAWANRDATGPIAKVDPL